MPLTPLERSTYYARMHSDLVTLGVAEDAIAPLTEGGHPGIIEGAVSASRYATECHLMPKALRTDFGREVLAVLQHMEVAGKKFSVAEGRNHVCPAAEARFSTNITEQGGAGVILCEGAQLVAYVKLLREKTVLGLEHTNETTLFYPGSISEFPELLVANAGRSR